MGPESKSMPPAPSATNPRPLPTEQGERCPDQPNSSFCPWPRCCPWLVIVAGVALGSVVGLSPWLFLVIGGLCLLSGCFVQRG